MRTRLAGVLVALAIALLVPTAALAADTPVAVYHGTWDSAGWVGCEFPSDVPASGNWNVTILPGGKKAAVHITMFALGMHIGSWGATPSASSGPWVRPGRTRSRYTWT